MKITKSLALTQVFTAKKRSIFFVFAIAMSTALLTAIICFVTSCENMFKISMGDSFKEHAAAYRTVIIIPAVLIALLVFAMATTVISSIFKMSARDRIKELGIMKCVGGTSKQICSTVVWEGNWLCLAGIPLGMIAGTVLCYTGILILNQNIEAIEEFSKNITMRKMDISLSFHVSVLTYVFSALFSFVTVLVSARKQGKLVSKLPALASINGDYEVAARSIKLKKTGPECLLKSEEAALAYTNVKRNSGIYAPVIKAFSLAIVLIMFTAFISGQKDGIYKFMKPESNAMIVDYASIAREKVDGATGRDDFEIVAPLHKEIYDEVTHKLRQYGDGDIFGVGSDSSTYRASVDKHFVTEEMLKADADLDEKGETSCSIMVLDEKNYEEFCRLAGVAPGSNILLNSYGYNDFGSYKNIEPYKENIGAVTIISHDGSKEEIKIDGTISLKDISVPYFKVPNEKGVKIIVPEAPVRFFDWYCDTEDTEAFTSFAQKTVDEYFPIVSDNPYVEQGYVVRISREEQMAKALNITMVLVISVLCAFVIMILVMGLSSVIGTIASNVSMRKPEFAVLKSVGMTVSSIKKTIYYENLFCVLRALFSGLIIGFAITIPINLAIRSVFPVKYTLPAGAIAVAAAVMCTISFLITKIQTDKIKNLNIIETIRMKAV